MNNSPLVSIIVPIYKVESYIHQCIESIINQTYSNIEIILVDDGSPDKCPIICDEYAKKDYRIKVIHKQNGGLSDARNAGIKIATASYLTFVDSDDICHVRMVEFLMKPLIADNTLKMSVCAYSCFVNIEEINTTNSKISDGLCYSYEDFMLNKNGITAWGKMFRKELFNSIIFPFGRLHEDVFTVYKLAYNAARIYCIDSPLYFYRKNNNSITGTISHKRINDAHDGIKENIDFYLTIKNEKLFYKYILFSTSAYCKFYRGHLHESENLLNQWKKELENYAFLAPLKYKFIVLFSLYFILVRYLIKDVLVFFNIRRR